MLRTTLLLVALTLTLAAPPLVALPFRGALYEPGERVEVTGMVTTPAGDPIEDVRVVLELSRKYFEIRKMWMSEGKLFKISDTTDASGEFTIAFPWDDYYNEFDLVAGITVRGAEGDELVELERIDLEKRIENGSPVVASLVVENHEFIERFREFLATVDSPDERRVYEDQGRPDSVRTTAVSGGRETAWWYFDRGRVYRFVDGTLQKVDEFDPVEEL